MRDFLDPHHDRDLPSDPGDYVIRSAEEVDAMEQRERDAEDGIGLDAECSALSDAGAANTQRIHDLTERLLSEFTRPLGVIQSEALRRAIPFGHADAVCRHGVRYFSYCGDCAASARFSRPLRSA